MEGRYKSNASAYVDRLVKWITDGRITLEVCLTSNENTMPSLNIEDHPFKKMVQERVSVTIATDNRLISNTNMVLELSKAVRTFALTPRQLKEIVITGFKRSFFPGSYAERRRYVRMAMDHFDIVAKKHGVFLS